MGRGTERIDERGWQPEHRKRFQSSTLCSKWTTKEAGRGGVAVETRKMLGN